MVDTPFHRRKNKSNVGLRAERLAAKRLKARVIAGSGAVPGRKGDLELGGMLIESKATTKVSLGVKLQWLRKITREALAVSKQPILMIQFVNENGGIVREGSWVCMPERMFKELVDEG